jgi:hypothetical protein
MMILVKKLCILNKFDDKAQHQGQVICHPRAERLRAKRPRL